MHDETQDPRGECVNAAIAADCAVSGASSPIQDSGVAGMYRHRRPGLGAEKAQKLLGDPRPACVDVQIEMNSAATWGGTAAARDQQRARYRSRAAARPPGWSAQAGRNVPIGRPHPCPVDLAKYRITPAGLVGSALIVMRFVERASLPCGS